jgi:hypothetical protein
LGAGADAAYWWFEEIDGLMILPEGARSKPARSNDFRWLLVDLPDGLFLVKLWVAND